jgi:diaminopimelate decarboxylase
MYAIKSNNSKNIIQTMLAHQPNMGFDVASKNEILTLKEYGVTDFSKVVLSNSVKQEMDIACARDHNITLCTADSYEELFKIRKIAPNMRILWRISIDENNKEKLATVFSEKFGDTLSSLEEVEHRLKEISELGFSLHGIHFHCGSSKDGSDSFRKAVELSRDCIRIGRKYGHTMEILDIGGGFPSGEISSKLIEDLEATRNDPLNY